MNRQEMEAARAELDDRDLDGRSRLLVRDLWQIVGSYCFAGQSHGDLNAAEREFMAELDDQLLAAIRGDADMVFIVEWPPTRGEAREAMDVADDAINRAVVVAVETAVGKHGDGLDATALRGIARLKARIKQRGHLNSDGAMERRERTLAEFPTCQECGE